MPLHQGHKLRYLLEKQKINLLHLAKELGISRSTLYNYFEQEEILRKKLVPIIQAAGLNENDFTESIISEPSAEYQRMADRVKSLEQMLHDKEMIISRQEEIIELLKRKKG